MTILGKMTASIIAITIVSGAPLLAQTVRQTKVDTDTSMTDGVATTKRTVTHTTKHKTRQPKKILGVQVGHKTAVKKTVRETSVSSNGDSSSTVKTTN
jgi:hypothetical protein